MNLILCRNVCLSGKHADITELRWGESITWRDNCHVCICMSFVFICLPAWPTCLHAWFSLYLPFCSTASLSVNLSFPFDRPCLIRPTIAATLCPQHFITGPHRLVSPSEYLSSNFTPHYFFMSLEKYRILALLHPTDPQGRRGQPPGDQTEAVC